MDTTTDLLTVAARVADEVLLPGALDVDRGRAPVGDRLDVLAGAGLHGLRGPTTHGGHDADGPTVRRVVETLAGGCLTTTLVWLQHLGVAPRLARAGGALADELLPALADGRVRAGVGVGGVRPGVEPVVARPDGPGHVLRGTVPWITGWGLVDVLLVAARDGRDGDVLWFLLDAPSVRAQGGRLSSAAPTVGLRRVTTVACDAASSAVVTLDDHPAPADRLVGRQPYAEWLRADAEGLRTNGALALGVAARCARLADDDVLAGRVRTVRERLGATDVAGLPAARAAAADLAWSAAQLLLVRTGGRAVDVEEHAQRLAREALLLQVFGTRPAISDALRDVVAARLG